MNTRSHGRLVGLDIARAIAVLGMVVVNYRLVMVTGDATPRWLTLVPKLFEGRAAATFVILAGVGLALLTRRARESQDSGRLRGARISILKRALFLFVVGIAYYSIYVGEILHYYGVYLAIAAFLFTARDRQLLSISVAAVLGFVVLLLTLDYEMAWNWETLEYADPWTARALVRRIFFNGFHPVLPWFAFIAFGLWLGRRPLADAGWRRRALGTSAAVAIATEALSRLSVRLASPDGPSELAQAILGTSPMPPMPQYVVAAAATSTAVIMLCLGLAERWEETLVCRALTSAGQLTLTLYVSHVLVGMTLLDLVGRLEGQTLPFALGCALFFWITGVVFSHLWRLRYQRGPLEALMRQLTG